MVLWVFGYSSLVWNAGFEYDDKMVGFIKGYRRTFHLACIDHRGTPEYPARAANLDAEEGAICWGIAYCIKEEEAAKKALTYLEVRECEYDIRTHVELFTEQSPVKPVLSKVLVFLTTPDPINNKYYLGPAPLMDMARQIATARGPNGPNYEYLFRLEEALRKIGHEDKEVIDLAIEVRRMLKERNTTHWVLLDGCLPRLLNGINNHQSQMNAIKDFRIPTLSSCSHSPRLLKSQAT